LMRRRAKGIREGQARERKKEGKPAYFDAYVKTRKASETGGGKSLLLSKKLGGKSHFGTILVSA